MRRPWLLMLLALGCSRATAADAGPAGDGAIEAGNGSKDAAAEDVAASPEPLRMELVDVPGDYRVLALRGPHSRRLAMVYLHGRCVFPGYYVDSFIKTAAERGDLVALQGDVSCGGDFVNEWSLDIAKLDRRIDEAFARANVVSREIVLIGYSQGADRAEALVARYPHKYKAVILIASSSPPSPVRLKTVRAAALMAGTRDIQTNMQAGLVALKAARIEATFIPLPDAWHGHMGSEPEVSMKRALDFVDPPETR